MLAYAVDLERTTLISHAAPFGAYSEGDYVKSNRAARVGQWRHAVVICALLAACTWQPPAMHTIPEPAPIPASFGKVWDAAVGHLSEHSIPIKVIERSSGVLTSEPFPVPLGMTSQVADCGSDALLGPYVANVAQYSIRVTGDSTSSNVRVTMAIFSKGPAERCTSKGKYETDLVTAIRAKAVSMR